MLHRSSLFSVPCSPFPVPSGRLLGQTRKSVPNRGVSLVRDLVQLHPFATTPDIISRKPKISTKPSLRHAARSQRRFASSVPSSLLFGVPFVPTCLSAFVPRSTLANAPPAVSDIP